MPHSRRSRSKCAADENAPRQRSQQDSGEASGTRRTLPLADVPEQESDNRKRTSLEVEGGEIGESSQAIKEKVERSQSSALPHGGPPEKAGPSSLLRTDSDGTGRHDEVQRRDMDGDCPRTEPSVQEFLANLKWRRLHQQNLTTTSNSEVRPPPAPPPSAVIPRPLSAVSQSERMSAQAPPMLITIENALPGPTGPGPPPLLPSTCATQESASISIARVAPSATVPRQQSSSETAATVASMIAGLDEIANRMASLDATPVTANEFAPPRAEVSSGSSKWIPQVPSLIEPSSGLRSGSRATPNTNQVREATDDSAAASTTSAQPIRPEGRRLPVGTESDPTTSYPTTRVNHLIRINKSYIQKSSIFNLGMVDSSICSKRFRVNHHQNGTNSRLSVH